MEVMGMRKTRKRIGSLLLTAAMLLSLLPATALAAGGGQMSPI